MNLSERFNEVIALDFDFTCTARLQVYDVEREERQLEAMTLGALTGMLGGTTKPKVSVTQKREEGSF